jgi:hypothetical protein
VEDAERYFLDEQQLLERLLKVDGGADEGRGRGEGKERGGGSDQHQQYQIIKQEQINGLFFLRNIAKEQVLFSPSFTFLGNI